MSAQAAGLVVQRAESHLEAVEALDFLTRGLIAAGLPGPYAPFMDDLALFVGVNRDGPAVLFDRPGRDLSGVDSLVSGRHDGIRHQAFEGFHSCPFAKRKGFHFT